MILRAAEGASAMVVLVFLTASSANAECNRVSPKMELAGPDSELVFSGKVVEITRTAELGYRATFDVDRVWLGPVTRRLDIYIWELAPETPRFEMGGTYVAIAKRVGERMREKVGLGGTKVVAFTLVTCSGGHSVSEFIRELGPGRPPKEPAPSSVLIEGRVPGRRDWRRPDTQWKARWMQGSICPQAPGPTGTAPA